MGGASLAVSDTVSAQNDGIQLRKRYNYWESKAGLFHAIAIAKRERRGIIMKVSRRIGISVLMTVF